MHSPGCFWLLLPTNYSTHKYSRLGTHSIWLKQLHKKRCCQIIGYIPHHFKPSIWLITVFSSRFQTTDYLAGLEAVSKALMTSFTTHSLWDSGFEKSTGPIIAERFQPDTWALTLSPVKKQSKNAESKIIPRSKINLFCLCMRPSLSSYTKEQSPDVHKQATETNFWF